MEQLETVSAIMSRFLERTRVGVEGASRRYLWTDAFAVCNLLTLLRETGACVWRDNALDLIDDVHHVLGQHRADDERAGWISGLSNAEGEAHPTVGGLRIGKPAPERPPDVPFDAEREWNRDGQYLHYLTRWMHALSQAASVLEQPRLLGWARELASTAVRSFASGSPGNVRGFYWKMSIDLKRPQVPSMGQNDALDAYLTCYEVEEQSTRVTRQERATSNPGVSRGELEALGRFVDKQSWTTDDALGIGGLLVDADRAYQLESRGADLIPHLAQRLIRSGRLGFQAFERSSPLEVPERRRLAFRELGLVIGLEALDSLDELLGGHPPEELGALRREVDALLPATRIQRALVDFWLDAQHRRGPAWKRHEDIDDVMLATALAPAGYLELEPRGAVASATGSDGANNAGRHGSAS
ncbi:MAG: hypothetical protein WD226_13205 [Planctomycetota bacterium]